MNKKYLAWGIGFGLALFPIHSEYYLNIGITLSVIGFIILVFCDYYYFSKTKQIDFGSKWVYIPMFVLIASAALFAVFHFSIQSIANTVLLVLMFQLYLASKIVGRDIFKMLAVFVIITAVSIFIQQIVKPGEIAGGMLGEYNIAAGYLALGAILSRGKWQWALVILSAIAIILTGSAEGLLVLGVMGIAILVRRDWGRRLWLPIGIASILIAILLTTGFLGNLYWRAARNVGALPESVSNPNARYDAFSGRIEIYSKSIGEIAWLGHGLKLGDFAYRTVHNVPLIIVDQLGIGAGVAWFIATGYCLVKTKWKYAWIAFIGLGLFDHMTWTMFAPFWWVMAGVTTSVPIANDYIFRRTDAGQPKPQLLGATRPRLQFLRMG